ncbi:uncharacterized protein TA21470 [Theileria annulata]|uniref:MORN repeat n=1 Tax=Theileria annulata TaxID=5874 RepID=Q4UGL3_THEAN|nr:uncharacterized protein TA21470 [Theileria annulata]CAI73776.1 hypothetical protein, conserved [Theileria annulata]|eukprot:XP_954453.1 hypothetical protein, conserved [Theileria annulata]
MIYSECAARTSTCILSLLTMIPCASSLNFNSKAFGSLWFNWKRYGFPLDLFRSDNPIYPYFTESMSPLLNETTGYLIGVTDLKILNKLSNPPTLIFDLEEEIIRLRTKVLLGYYSPSFYEISFFDDFELLDELDIDDEPLKMVVDTSENIFNFVGDYLSRAPSTIIELGGKASKIYHMGRRLGMRRHKESYLRLFDIYFPGALPKFLRFSKKGSKSKKKKAKESEKVDEKGEKTEEGLDKVAQCDDEQKDSDKKEDEHEDKTEEKDHEESTDKFSDVGENDEVGAQDRASEYKKIKGFDPLGELKAQWDELTKQDDEDGKVSEVVKEEEEEDLAVVNTTFTFEMMFEKMMKRSPKYRYLGYVQYLQYEDSKDRNREIEYAILTRIQPLRDFLLKLLKSFAYAGGKGRRPYHLLMDFFFELDSVIDFNNPVEGVYIVRGEEYLRGCMQELPDSDTEEHQDLDESYKKSYIMEGDQEVKLKLPSILATHVVEIQNNYSIDFVELWIRTHNFKEFYMNHNLEVFNEPVFYVSQNVAKYTYPNGDFYVGELVDMLRDGKGSYVSKDGSRYDGEWLRDKRHGKGTLITNDIKYTGDWLNDKKHGFGRLETRSYTYVGDFRHNRCHGNGTMSYKSGIKQKGEFKHGRFEGKGMMTMPDGSVRMGNFKNGVIFGVCSVIDKTGRVYVGQLHGDLFHGKGILKYNKTTSFEGYWVKGRRVNQGMINTIISGSPLRVEAVWQDDNMLMNEVSIKFPNGFKYNGSLRLYPHQTLNMQELKDDLEFMKLDPMINEEDLKLFAQEFDKLDNKLLAHGNGIYKDTKGEVYNGLFFYGSKHGNMSQVFPNGTIYTGQYHLGRLHGKGTFQLLTKRTLEVKFNRGNLETELDFQDHAYIKQFLELEYPTFLEEFVKYKLDSLMDVMKTSNILGFNM